MQVSIGLIKDLGFKKIYNHYKVDVKEISIRKELNNKDNLSAFSVANKWNTTYGVNDLVVTSSFVKWYKMYYPMVGQKEVQNDQVRVLNASKRLQKDFESATGVILGNFLIYAPMLEMYSIKQSIELTAKETILCTYVDTIYRWAIVCSKLKNNMNKSDFEEILEALTYDTKDFFEYLGLETNLEGETEFGSDLF